MMYCAQCGTPALPSAKFCQKCGATVEISVQPTAPPISVSSAANPSDVIAQVRLPHTEISAPSNPEELYKAIIGSKNQDYYLNHFTRFDSNGKVCASWHWPAFFLTFYWFLYRKMWLNALIYFLLPYLAMIPMGVAAAMAGESADTIIGIGYLLYLVGIFLLPPMYANAIYYKHCKKKISETSASTHDVQRQLGELSGKGGTSNVALIIVFVFVFIAVIGILAAIAIPAYSSYTTKAKAMEGITLGFSASKAVEDYYINTGKIPATLEEAGFIPTTGKYVSIQ